MLFFNLKVVFVLQNLWLFVFDVHFGLVLVGETVGTLSVQLSYVSSLRSPLSLKNWNVMNYTVIMSSALASWLIFHPVIKMRALEHRCVCVSMCVREKEIERSYMYLDHLTKLSRLLAFEGSPGHCIAWLTLIKVICKHKQKVEALNKNKVATGESLVFDLSYSMKYYWDGGQRHHFYNPAKFQSHGDIKWPNLSRLTVKWVIYTHADQKAKCISVTQPKIIKQQKKIKQKKVTPAIVTL